MIRLPRNPVILPMIARATPESAVLLIKINRRDRPRRFGGEPERVTHAPQLAAHPRRHFVVERDAAGLRQMFAKGGGHLIARKVRRFARLLHVHAELDYVQKKLEQILVLRVTALHGKTEEQLS